MESSVVVVYADVTTHTLAWIGETHQALCRDPLPPSTHAMLLHTCERIEWYAAGPGPCPVDALSATPAHEGWATALVRLAQIAAGTHSLIPGERFIYRQVSAALARLPSQHPLVPLASEALRLAEQARSLFGLHAAVDWADLPHLLLADGDPPADAPGQLLIIGGGMLARAVAAAAPPRYGRVVMMTRRPRKLRRLVAGLDTLTVVRHADPVRTLQGRPYDTVIATTNLHPAYRDQVRRVACAAPSRAVVDLCARPALAPRPARHQHLADPAVLRTLHAANARVLVRAELARRWIADRATVPA